jgi:hypothetical protein
MSMANEAIILVGSLAGKGTATRRAVDRVIKSMPDAEDYETRTAEGRWWVVYTCRGRAPDEIIRRTALHDLRTAANKMYPGLLD